MKKYLVLLILIYPALLYSKDIFHRDTQKALMMLDSLVLNNDRYVKEKLASINELKRTSENGTSEEVYWKNKQIYYEYKTFNSDSAIIWLDKLDRLAAESGIKNEMVRNKIERAYIYAATGLLLESLQLLESINTAELPESILKLYYNKSSYLYMHLYQYSMTNNADLKKENSRYYQQKSFAYNDSLERLTTSADEHYLWTMAWKYRETDSLNYYKALIEEELKNKQFTDRQDAMLLYALGHLYAEQNDEVGKINALAYSAMADIKSANREIASLQELGEHLFLLGDIDRTYSYINLCLKNAQVYKARIRAVEIANVMDKVYKMNIHRNEQREAKLTYSFIGLMIITFIAILSIIIVAVQFKRLRKSHRALTVSNDLLNKNIEKLTSTQKELKEANLKLKSLNTDMLESNRVKEEYIGHVFNLCSNYLSKMDENQKKLKRSLRSINTEGFSKIIESPILIDQEIKEFYHNFDAVFLNLYPDFIEEFNKLLRPEERIILKSHELLNTELRIYALVRLGINDSTKIAEFLRISPQTVYNNRLKIRNRAIVGKDEFVLLVRKLGKINMQST